MLGVGIGRLLLVYLLHLLGAGIGRLLLVQLLQLYDSGNSAEGGCDEAARDVIGENAGDDSGVVPDVWLFTLAQFLDPVKEDLFSTLSEFSYLRCFLGAGTGGRQPMSLLHTRDCGNSAGGGCGCVARDDTGVGAGDSWSFALLQFLDLCKEYVMSTW